MNTFRSDISGREFPDVERVYGNSIKAPLLEFIRKIYPDFTEQSSLSITELNTFRSEFLAQTMQQQIGELDELSRTVLESLRDQTLLSDKLEENADAPLTLGQQLADRVAEFGGSWTFIIAFGIFILCWIAVNVYLLRPGFDPYPFILLNLLLSCLAAIQAPIIMMSQNRQDEKDRDRSRKDYMINLKAEVEIRMLHEKIDHLMMKQQQHLLAIQQEQIEMLGQILDKISDKHTR
ncbi:DUF1003 domain-containing protein [Rhodoflexus caldus]|uniref:DUF1003 domain-containing protein n=1 Tax=Rhodoflexus caldus TaxID=2891236 RepID=UPI00202A28F2|nr:DUF1003 domain-containing protein [Rhodoflexus caldus]